MALRGRGSYNVEFRFDGNWFKFNEITSGTNILMIMAARQGQKEFAEEYRDRVKANIITGGKKFGYPGNQERYLIRKVRKGGASTALVWSRAFYDAVTIRENRIGSRFMVGIPKNIKRGEYYSSDANRLTIAEYANVLEHGSSKIPSRPVFSDTFRIDMLGLRGLKKYMELALIRKFGTVGINVMR